MPIVLLVDADPDTRDLYGLALALAGFTVVDAACVASAIALAHDRPPALVLTAWTLPDGEAPEICRRLHSGGGDAQLPIIAISERPRAEVRQEAAHAGCEAVLSAPVMPDHLVEIAWHLVRRDRRRAGTPEARWPSPTGWSHIAWHPRRRLRDQVA